ncbi:uncharacterized protein LOC131664165 [Phymastichus coffea]|uniref:uncharacterized protein LOC131664165 n=1 Tax=Phymastichus coffea TaxID=108790 RepID=UPI00273AF032|nr:uncharacterized protein LOC131664165 [Phymastichus coffea]
MGDIPKYGHAESGTPPGTPPTLRQGHVSHDDENSNNSVEEALRSSGSVEENAITPEGVDGFPAQPLMNPAPDIQTISGDSARIADAVIDRVTLEVISRLNQRFPGLLEPSTPAAFLLPSDRGANSMLRQRLDQVEEMLRSNEAATATLRSAVAAAEGVLQKNLELENATIRRLEVNHSQPNNSLTPNSSTPLNNTNLATRIPNNSDILDDTNINFQNVVQPVSINTVRESVTENSFDVNKELSESIGALAHSIAKNNNVAKDNFKREYKLTRNMNLNIWFDYLNSELEARDLLDVIDPSTSCAKPYDTFEKSRRNKIVRDIIINHLEEDYHKKILDVKDPIAILSIIKDAKKLENNVSEVTVRAKLYSMKIGRSEKVDKFCDRFNAIIKESELCGRELPLTEAEKRCAFYQAVKDEFPGLSIAYSIKKANPENSNMTLDEIKSIVLQLEADAHRRQLEARGQANVADAAQTAFGHRGGTDACWRCNKHGHAKDDCPLITTNEWFCYVCRRIASHNGRNCPNNGRGNSGSRGYVNNIYRGNYKKGQSSEGVGYNGVFRGRGNNNNNRGRNSNNRGKNNKGNRGGSIFRGKSRSFKSNARPYTPHNQHQNNAKTAAAHAAIQGKSNTHTSTHNISFLADSGATEHIINKGFILSNFKECPGAVIRSANKNSTADIKIDGKGDLVLEKLDSQGKIVVLPNVLAAENISENLMSLRKFVDAGFSIYLDDRILKVFDKETNHVYLSGVYNKPNWIISLSIKSPVDVLEEKYHSYRCNARMITLDEAPEETPVKSSNVLDENNQNKNIDAELERECIVEEINSSSTLNNNPSLKHLNCKLVDIDSLEDADKIENLFTSFELEKLHTEKLNKELQKLDVNLKGIKFDENIMNCETCILAKLTKLPFKETRTRATKPLYMIHADTIGPIKPISFPDQCRYIIVFVDDCTKFALAYSVKHKSESGGKFLEVMKREGIEPNFSSPHTPPHNGTAERFNRTLIEKTRSLMIDSDLPKSMWPFAVDVSINLYNRTPNKSIDFKIPLKLINPESKCHIDKIRRFGSIAYAAKHALETKFSAKAIKGVLDSELEDVKENTVHLYGDNLEILEVEENNFKNLQQTLNQNMGVDSSVIPESKENKKTRSTEQTIGVEPVRKQPKRNVKTAKDYKAMDKGIPDARMVVDTSFAFLSKIVDIGSGDKDESAFALLAVVNHDPISFKEAMSMEDKGEWLIAVKEELKSMEINKVWSLVDRPTVLKNGKRANVIDSRWVFKKKLDKLHILNRKGRLVIRGFMDKNNYELRETYAPVSRLPVIRAALAVINKLDLEVRQLDVKTAFLNGTLDEDEEIYMEIPEGLEVDEFTRKTKVCRLHKVLYGLKISPKKWNERFTEEVLKLGLQKDINEPCLFTYRYKGIIVFLVLYVDDIITASNCSKKLKEIIDHLSGVFQMKNLGEPKQFLGMTIKRDRGSKILKINQTEYVYKVLERFGMTDCNPHETPMVTRQARSKKINQVQDKTMRKLDVPYREVIGCISYLANASRPDISFAVNFLSRKQSNPSEEDWLDVKRVLRYLKGTAELGLTFRSDGDTLEAYSDSSFKDWPDSTSTSGMVISLYKDTVAWRSHKQTLVTSSTCGSEYLAMSEVCKDIISLDKALRDILGYTMYPVTLYCDNQSARDCTQKEGSHKLKDFDDTLEEIKKHLVERERTGVKRKLSDTHGDFVKQCVLEGKVSIRGVSTHDNVADIFTKPLSLQPFRKYRNILLNHYN